MTRYFQSLGLAALLLVLCARTASAQTYIWTDDRGVVHAASDPSEVPPKYREKSVRDASKAKPGVKIVPNEEVPAAPRGHSASINQSGGGANIDVNPEVAPGAAIDDKPSKKKSSAERGPYGLPPADEGFEWHCASDPEGGAPHCQQLEKKYHKRERRAEARDKARKEMGIDDPTQEFDPDVAKKVDRKAQEEFDRTAPEPSTKGVVRPNMDDQPESDSSETDE